jgi:hypothetical protein
MPERVVPFQQKISTSLTILSSQLSPEELQTLIGLAPDRSWHLGDPIGRSGRAFQPFSGWSIRDAPSEDLPASHLSGMLDRVASVKENIAIAARDPRVHSVALWLWSQGRTFGMDLPAARLAEIAAMGATLKIDVYDGDPDGADAETPPE